MTDPRWLSEQERELWLTLAAVTQIVPAAIEAQLRRDHGLTRFEYYVLVMLSEHEDQTRPMSDLALLTNGSLSRLSHAVTKMEKRGLITRAPSPTDRRTQLITLAAPGREQLVAAAPAHVEEVRRVFFDALPEGAVAQLTQLLRPVVTSATKDGPCPQEPSSGDCSVRSDGDGP